MTVATTEELVALREGAALCRHGLRFVMEAKGPDTLGWLERLASQSVTGIAAGAYVRATLMDGKGKLRADLRVLAVGDPTKGVLLDLPASHKAGLLRLLDMYIIKEDVKLRDRAGDVELLSVIGPKAKDVLDAAGLPTPAEGSLDASAPGVTVLPSTLGGAPGFDLLVDADADPRVEASLTAAGAVPADTTALDVVRIEHGTPWFGPDLSVEVIPLEAHLDDVVSITKGCYPGQEVVARIQNLGQVSRKLVRLEADGELELEWGVELTGTGEMDGKNAGVVTSVAFDPVSSRTVALGYARRAFWNSGTVLASPAGDVRVVSLAGD